MSTIRLDGCRTVPLLAYLKSLGLLAAVAEQFEPRARGWWSGGRFHLDLPDSSDGADLIRFVAEDYALPPILSPWNSRGGFRTDRDTTSEKRLAAIEASESRRLESFRRSIAAGRKVWSEAEKLGLLKKGTVDTKRKVDFVRLCRGRLPDDALPWIDAAVVLLDDDVRYPDLLGGTGGNFGSGDISSNVHEAALWLTIDERVGEFVEHSLFGLGSPKLPKLLVGQFDPSGAGGVNMGPSSSIVNPIDLLLGIHGACLFAAGVARRLDGRKAASVPFTVRPSAGAVRTMADGENVRAELWLPEWSRPLGLGELKNLLAEGRAQWSGRQSTSSLDFARAAASLGVDRDITHFSRYLVAERLGQSNLAVSVGRFEVGERRGVELTAAIDPFVSATERIANPTRAVSEALKGLRSSMFQLAEADSNRTPEITRDVLGRTYLLELVVGRSSSAREKVTRPVSELRATDWEPLLDDGTPEYRVARAIVSQHDRAWQPERGRQAREVSAMNVMCRPVERAGVTRMTWSGRAPFINLAGPNVLEQIRKAWKVRGMRCAQHPPDRPDSPLLHTPGIDVAFSAARPCPLADVIAFGQDRLDEKRIVAWLTALAMLSWDQRSDPELAEASGSPPAVALGPGFGAIVPFFTKHPVVVTSRSEVSTRVRFHPTSAHVAAVSRGDVRAAIEGARSRLAQFGVDMPPVRTPIASVRHLDAALVPLTWPDVQRAVHSVAPAFQSPSQPVEESS